jgi:hypothetical protein
MIQTTVYLTSATDRSSLRKSNRGCSVNYLEAKVPQLNLSLGNRVVRYRASRNIRSIFDEQDGFPLLNVTQR